MGIVIHMTSSENSILIVVTNRWNKKYLVPVCAIICLQRGVDKQQTKWTFYASNNNNKNTNFNSNSSKKGIESAELKFLLKVLVLNENLCPSAFVCMSVWLNWSRRLQDFIHQAIRLFGFNFTHRMKTVRTISFTSSGLWYQCVRFFLDSLKISKIKGFDSAKCLKFQRNRVDY